MSSFRKGDRVRLVDLKDEGEWYSAYIGLTGIVKEAYTASSGRTVVEVDLDNGKFIQPFSYNLRHTKQHTLAFIAKIRQETLNQTK